MVTYKFLNVIEKCINCGGCFAACKDQNHVPHGTARVQIVTINEGVPGERNVPVSCMHCTDPPCEAACPVKAIEQRADGVVLMDKDKCIGCGYCGWACPFGAPQYPHDLEGAAAEYDGIMDKCTLCMEPFIPTGSLGAPNPKCALFCATKARLGGDITAIMPQYRVAKARNISAWQERV